MTRFERNERALIKKVLSDEIDESKLGYVSRVYEHGAPSDDSNFEADVIVDAGTSTEKRCQIGSPGAGAIDIPRVGDRVIVSYRDGQSNSPYISNVFWTNERRPPIGQAGIWRRSFESGSTPAGSGDLYVTGYTSYDGNPARNDYSGMSPEESFVRIEKNPTPHTDPTNDTNQPISVEVYDSPSNNSSYVSVELNKVNGSDSADSWGIKFDISDGSFTIADGSNFGITSDGSGNFTWEHKSIDFNEISGSTGNTSV